MQRRMKRYVCAACAVGALVGASLPDIQTCAATVDSGTCGKNLTWALEDDGTLTISGDGGNDGLCL